MSVCPFPRVGTYGSHGLEFVHLSTSLTRPSRSSRPPTPSDDAATLPGTDPDPDPATRILTATKLTGDTNVPSGETTWIAFLDDLASSPRRAGRARGSRSVPVGTDDTDDDDDDSIPSISDDKWTRMNQRDPNRAPGATFSAADWLEGTTKGVGQIALSGFLQPGWTAARVRFVRTETTLERNRVTGQVRRLKVEPEPSRVGLSHGDERQDREAAVQEEEDEEEWETRVVESVEEIQLRWAELNKIALFRRVRI